MHELLVSRGFVRRAEAPSLAEVKEREAIADAAAAEAAAVRKKERAEAAAKRKLDKEAVRKPSKKRTDKDRTKVPLLLCFCVFYWPYAMRIPRAIICFEASQLDE